MPPAPRRARQLASHLSAAPPPPQPRLSAAHVAAPAPADLQQRAVSIDRQDTTAKTLDFSEIPIVDIAGLDSPDPDKRMAVAREIDRACRRVGFLYVKNHGVPEAAINAAFAASKLFFALPEEEKLELDINKGTRHRGYVGYGGLNADINNPDAADIHEALEVGLDLPPDDPDFLAGNPMYGPNMFPASVARSEMADPVNEYVDEMVRAGRRIFRGFALALGLPETWFEDKITKPMGQLRMLHYPPQSPKKRGTEIGIGAHTDYECFTILAQDADGLQVLNASSEWVAAPPVPGCLLINIGDCMMRWTNDVYRSTVHRVVNLSGGDRYSLVFFFGADYGAVVECLPTCLGPSGAKYPPVRAGEWTVRNIRESYKYKPPVV
ncbi:putative iron/ascorbate oxidoreductase [Hyaloraphidium curvatum]|nr:putative iron/ascorbate oxidoreductase [Hyaloraphidium curvatum]